VNKYLTKIAQGLEGIVEQDPPSVYEYGKRNKPDQNLGSMKQFAIYNPSGTRDTYDSQVKMAAAAVATTTKKQSTEDKLRPQQLRALKKLDKTHGLLLAHGTGTGKTMTFLAAVEQAQKRSKTGRSLIISPASLTSNVDKEVNKHHMKIDMSRVDVMSYDEASRNSQKLQKNKYILAIADEAQKLRNVDTQRHTNLSGIIEGADYRVLATATPSYNHVANIAPLVNIAAGGKQILPEDKKVFDAKYISKKEEAAPFMKRIFGAPSKEVESLKNKDDLKSRLNAYVDYYNVKDDPEAESHFPTENVKTVDVDMSPQQHQLYKYMEGKLPWPIRLKVRTGMPMSKKESAQLNAFSSGVRQVSNSTKAFMPKYQDPTPKMKAAADSVQKAMKTNKNFRGIAYSNYLTSGLDDYSTELNKRGISNAIYSGKLTKTQKDALVKDYNSGKLKMLLISSSGGEGLDLKDTRKVQVLEPHFNKSKIDQVVGRAARYDSHINLPKKDQNVEVEHYLSVFPPGFLGKSKSKSIDQYLTDNSETKSELVDQMNQLMDDDNKKDKKKWV